MITAQLALDARAVLGESPVWDRGALTWVDILSGTVHRTRLGQATTDAVIDLGEHVGFVAPREDGRFVAGVAGGVRLVDVASGHPLLARLPIIRPGLRMNDGKVAPGGHLVAGTMAYDLRPGAGTLWSWDGRDVVALVADVTVPNGLAWSADDRTMYFIDTPTGRVDAFTYDSATGTATDRRPHASIPQEWGSPDGMAIDADGALWVAMWGGGAIVRIDPSGTSERVVWVPTPRTTSCTWAGPWGLAITTASTDGTTDATGAGGLYLADIPGVSGPPLQHLPAYHPR